MEFLYSLDKLEKLPTPKYSQAVLDSLGKNALGTNADLLIGRYESSQSEKMRYKIESQSTISIDAVYVLIDRLNILRGPDEQIRHPTTEEFQTLLDSKLERWQNDGSLDYCNEYIEQNGGDIILLATPNSVATLTEITNLVENFGESKNPPQQTSVRRDFYAQYSPEELSGEELPDQLVRLSLIPTSPDPTLEGTASQQLEKFKNLQAINSNIQLQVPSVLDSVAYWQALRSRGDDLADNTTYSKTRIRHVNLPAKHLEGWSDAWPESHISGSGWPCLSNSLGDPRMDDLRVAVG